MSELKPERVTHAEWSGERVSVDEILSQLGRLHAQFAARGAGDYELPRPRNSVMNLVVVASDARHAENAARVGEELGVKHPSRTIVVEPMGSDGDRIDAAIRSHAHELLGGAPLQYEEVRLRVWGTRARLRSLIEPLLVSDVRTHLWWLGTPPWQADEFRDVLADVDTLIVDSAAFERPFESLLALARVADAVEEPRGVGDFEWVRLHPWREALAQAFAPAHRVGMLRGVGKVELEYAGEGRANRGSIALMAGWLIESLHWELLSASAGKGGLLRGHYQAPHGHVVELAARSVPPPRDVPDGMLMAIRIEAATGGETAKVEMSRRPEEPREASLTLHAGEDEPLEHQVLLDDLDEATLLSEVLSRGRRDPVYQRSLRSAAQLFDAVR